MILLAMLIKKQTILKKEKLLEAKEENQILKEQAENELRERRGELQRQETRLLQKKKIWIGNLIF
ncbi:Rnase Y domain-containing protein [Staphylococcus epidermidis]